MQIDICDARGIKMISIEHKQQAPGHHSIQIHGETMEPGIYYYSMNAGSFFQTKMMVRY